MVECRLPIGAATVSREGTSTWWHNALDETGRMKPEWSTEHQRQQRAFFGNLTVPDLSTPKPVSTATPERLREIAELYIAKATSIGPMPDETHLSVRVRRGAQNA